MCCGHMWSLVVAGGTSAAVWELSPLGPGDQTPAPIGELGVLAPGPIREVPPSILSDETNLATG